MNLIDTIRNTIEYHGLIPDGTKVVAGISGGADSVALLHALHSLRISLTVAHLNHQLRDGESGDDEEFVRRLAAELNFPIVVKSVDVKTMAASNGLSIEMAARQARHDFFGEFGEATIVLAHHADDQVETFILKLARGAGSEGLSGMPYCREIGAIRLIRPMLDIPRPAILQWLKVNEFTWREDASNSDETFLRNRVRHTILPLLEKELNPNIRETILRTMDVLREENRWMDRMTHPAKPNELSGLPLAARRRVLRKWLFENGVAEVNFDTVETILALMDKGNGSTVYELNDRQRVVVEYGVPRLAFLEEPSKEPGWAISVKAGSGWKMDHGQGIGILPADASFDAEKVGGAPIEVRTFQPGDRIDPLGMEGSRKLQDIFTDQKVPKARRSRIPVVVCRDEIIWLPGYRIARDWAVRNEHGKSVHVHIEQSPPE